MLFKCVHEITTITSRTTQKKKNSSISTTFFSFFRLWPFSMGHTNLCKMLECDIYPRSKCEQIYNPRKFLGIIYLNLSLSFILYLFATFSTWTTKKICLEKKGVRDTHFELLIRITFTILSEFLKNAFSVFFSLVLS